MMNLEQISAYDCLTSLLYRSLQEADPAFVRAELSRFADRLHVEDNQEDLLSYLFTAALMKRLDTAKSDQMNLYLKQYDVPQITLFNLLADQFPLMTCVTSTANRMLAHEVRAGEPLRFLEIGIGTGRQIVLLLKLLAEQGKLPSSLTLYAIEPSEHCMQLAEKNVKEAAECLGIPLHFHPYCMEIERLPGSAWDLLQRQKGAMLVNASFALHHIRDNGAQRSMKDEILRRIQQLQPSVFVLCEPDSNHQTSDLGHRFYHSWRHFSVVFHFIDSLPLQIEEKRALKIFFGREIEDIIASLEELRCERHELTEQWTDRLRQAGFHPSTIPGAAFLPKLHPEVAVTKGSWHVGFGHSSTNLISVIGAM